MRFDLSAMSRRVSNPRRKSVDLRVIQPPATLEAGLAAIYMRVVRAWAEVVAAQIMPAYEQALMQAKPRDSLTRDDASTLGLQTDFAEEALRRLVLTLTPEMRRWVFRVEAWHRGKWRGAVLTATAVDITTMVGPEDVRETLETVVGRNVALIKNVSAEEQARISDVVFRGLQARSPARDVAKQINEAVAMSRRRALNIAADQLQKLSSDLDAERMREAGIDEWLWRHSGKLHFRPEHKARDGNLYTDKTAPKDLPGQLPFCGCRRQAHISFN